jgi:uncharacterized repeat protein (TIGR02543 family)
LGDAAFTDWKDVKILKFEEGAYVKAIGKKAFMGCTNLEEVDFTNCGSMTEICAQAFSGCSKLKTITFNEKLQYIDNNAFEKCVALESVDLVPGLIRLESSAFSGCSSLTKVTLETANVSCKTSSGSATASSIFYGCNIKTIEFAFKVYAESADGTKNNIIVPANLFNKATFAEDADIVIPATIQEIGSGAFQDSNLKKISFQDTEENPSALSTISDSAFKQCAKLESVAFPSALQTIGAYAFQTCTGLTTVVIPNTVTNLGGYAFQGCSGITSLTLSNGTTAEGSIGTSAFAKCTALEEIAIPEGLTFTGVSEFQECTKLSKVTFPSTMENIGNTTFKSCTALVGLTLPDSVVSVGTSAFEGCTSLQKMVYSANLTTIGASAFKSCSLLYTNSFPDTLETIGASAFEGCYAFSNQIIPANVTSIGTKAFAGCKGIDVLTIQTDKLKTCGAGIFNECMLRQVNFPEGITVIPANLFSQAKFTTDAVMTIPSTVTTIGAGAFAGTSTYEVNISKVVFEENSELKVIGSKAFAYCTALQEFTFPDSTEEIGANAFEGCKKITAITIPENVTKIGASAFSGCQVLADITYNAIAVTTSNQKIFEKCNVKRITLGEKVTRFPAYLFYGAQFSTNSDTGEADMISLEIPASVEEIGAYALPNVSNLQKLVFEEGFNFTSVGQYAFSQCINLTSCNLPDSVTSIGNYAFSGCAKLGTDSSAPFTIPKNLTTLGSGAFNGCTGLTEVEIPEGVKTIGDKAFQNDTGLEKVTLAGGALTEISTSAFEGCISLKEITIPNGVTTIGASAFKGCSALTKVVIPATVTKIGTDAFSGCGNAQFMVVPGSYAEQWLKDAGIDTNLLLTITYVLNADAKEASNAATNPAGYETGDNFTFAPATRKGYLFAGWYLDENLQTAITGVEGYSENLVVYAKWELAHYDITYVLGEGGVNSADNPATYTYEDAKITLKDAERDGYSFAGWYTDLDDAKSKVTAINAKSTGDKTLYAMWKEVYTSAPTASIPSGTTVKAGTRVFLSSDAAGANIYYTVDGTEPTAQSSLYTEGIVINEALTLKAIAVKKGSLASEIVTFRYELLDESKDWGDIPEEDRGQFDDALQVPDGIWVAGVENVTYTGKKITFENLRVYDHKTLLKEKTDYTVKYANNQNAADKDAGKKAPSVTITAKGNYKGKETVYFSILKKDISTEEFSAADMVAGVNGKAQKPVPVLYYGKTKLRNKKDYTVTYVGYESTGYQSKGEYTIRLEGAGNYTGERNVAFTLAEGTSIAKAKITGLAAVDYTGAAITQSPVVKVGKDTLQEGEHYEISYSNNVDAGTATVTVTGKGSYYGTKKATFKIKPISTLNKVTFKLSATSVSYTGQPYELGKGIEVTADFGSNKLEQGKDYTCTYAKNMDAGTATIVFTGKGGYAGTVKKTFKIVAADISKQGVAYLDEEGNAKADASYEFVQGGVKPSVEVKYNGQTLTAGKDYTIAYTDNLAKGTANITIKGKKNFKGIISDKFTITQKDISGLSVTASDAVYKNAVGVAAGAKPVVRDTNGQLLVEGTDYKVSYSYMNDTRLADGTTVKAGTNVNMTKHILPAETEIKVTVTGQGSYKGTAAATARICSKSIASAKVTVRPQTYTGEEVQPGSDQIAVKVGKDELKAGEYVIVGYENNVKKGTAKITIRGVGNYGGTKTATFKITEKTFSLFKKISG